MTASQCVGRKDFTEGATVYLDEDGTWLPGVVIKTCQNGWRTIRVDGREKPLRIRGTEQLRPKKPTFTDGVRRTVFALRPLRLHARTSLLKVQCRWLYTHCSCTREPCLSKHQWTRVGALPKGFGRRSCVILSATACAFCGIRWDRGRRRYE